MESEVKNVQHTITLQDCYDAYEKGGYELLINDGKLTIKKREE